MVMHRIYLKKEDSKKSVIEDCFFQLTYFTIIFVSLAIVYTYI